MRSWPQCTMRTWVDIEARVTTDQVTMVNNVNMVEGCEGDLVTAVRGLQLGHSEHCEH